MAAGAMLNLANILRESSRAGADRTAGKILTSEIFAPDRLRES